MLTLVKTAAAVASIELRPGEPRAPGPGEILLKVQAAGVCGTDMQIYHWAPRMARRMKLPRVLGHEAGGVVAEVGPGVTNVKVGDKVSLESHIFCGACFQCRTERAHLCTATRYPGIDVDGVFAEYATVPASIAWVNPPDLPDEVAAVLEPFGIAVHATLEGTGVSGLAVLVDGCGPIGLMNVAVARRLGARLVIAVDPNPLRRETAARMGADRVVDPRSENVHGVARDMTGGRGVDVAIEYSGQPEGFQNCFESLTSGGDLRLGAAPAHPVETDFTRWLLKCPKVYPIHGRRIWTTWAQATPLIYEKQIDLKPVLSHILPLAEAPRAFELILNGEAVKPIIVPG
jgi:threonine 3-dehydrogenase